MDKRVMEDRELPLEGQQLERPGQQDQGPAGSSGPSTSDTSS